MMMMKAVDLMYCYYSNHAQNPDVNDDVGNKCVRTRIYRNENTKKEPGYHTIDKNEKNVGKDMEKRERCKTEILERTKNASPLPSCSLKQAR